MNEQELQAFLKVIEDVTREATKTPEKARQFLIDGGLLNEDGTLPKWLRKDTNAA